jgi:hypothetical protein
MQLIPRSLNFYINENGSKILKRHGKIWIEIPINNSQAEILFDFSKEKYLCYIWNLVTWTYSHIPLDSKLIRKDGNELNNHYSNFEIFNQKIKQTEKKETTDKNNKQENIEQKVDLKEEEYDHFFGDCKVPEPHEDFRRTFEPDIDEYNLEGCFDLFNDGEKWKQAYYFDQMLKNYYISENMNLYNTNKKRNVKVSSMDIDKNGESIFSFTFNDSRKKRIHLKDVIASTFLYVPQDAILVVYKSWNKKVKNKKKEESKYKNQKNHYTNLHWITLKDLHRVTDEKGFENFWVSSYGDVYSVNKHGNYQLLKETQKTNGLRKTVICINGSLTRSFLIHELVAKYFVSSSKPYKFVVHRDGDLSNNHYRNLVCLNTLCGIYNDGIMYYQIPNFEEYLVSETNVPYSFRFGTLKRMTLTTDKDGYKILQIQIDKKCYNLRYHRVIAVTRGKNFIPSNVIDHINGDKGDYSLDNLQCVTHSVNSMKKKCYKGRKIHMINLEGEILGIFENAEEASNKYKISKQLINRCANRNEKEEYEKESYGGYIWEYVEKREIYKPKIGETFVPLVAVYKNKLIIFESYSISNYGTVINIITGFSRQISRHLYPLITFWKDRESCTFQIHNLVALAFVKGRTSERNQVNHIDENPRNYRADNLEWVTASENTKHSSYKHFKPVAQLNLDTLELIRIFESRKAAAEIFGAKGGSRVSDVCNNMEKSAYNYRWRDLTQKEYQEYIKETQMKNPNFIVDEGPEYDENENEEFLDDDDDELDNDNIYDE